MQLRINHAALEIRNGFTHYPQDREQWRFFKGDPERPSRIILLDGSGSISLDVLVWLSEQDIALIQLDYRGYSVAVCGNAHRGGAKSKLMQAQIQAASDPRRSMEIATWLVCEKLARSKAALERAIPKSEARMSALSQAAADIERLSKDWSGDLPTLLGIEGRNAELYFKALKGISIRWKGPSRHPVPEAWKSIGNRRRGSVSKSARHPFQAMLNYAYGVMEGHIRIEAQAMGLDLTIGFLHTNQPERGDRSNLALDLLEFARPRIDEALLNFIADQTLCGSDFTISTDGMCRLHPQLARKVVDIVSQASAAPEHIRKLVDRIGDDRPLRRVHRRKKDYI